VEEKKKHCGRTVSASAKKFRATVLMQGQTLFLSALVADVIFYKKKISGE
jgi:hypothetical protein